MGVGLVGGDAAAAPPLKTIVMKTVLADEDDDDLGFQFMDDNAEKERPEAPNPRVQSCTDKQSATIIALFGGGPYRQRSMRRVQFGVKLKNFCRFWSVWRMDLGHQNHSLHSPIMAVST